MSNCAIIYICTGKYEVFWKDFYETAENFFLQDSKKEYFLFTDSKTLIETSLHNVTPVFWKRSGWPYDTMMRWECIACVQDKIKEYDYAIYCNANTLFLRPLNSWIFEEKTLTLLSYSGQDMDCDEMPFERNQLSAAYIPYGSKPRGYMQGGLIGGSVNEFIYMALDLRDLTMKDLSKGIIPRMHDESLINAYIFNHNNMKIKILDNRAVIPEEYQCGVNSAAIFRNKDQYGGNFGLRNNSEIGKIVASIKKFLFTGKKALKKILHR